MPQVFDIYKVQMHMADFLCKEHSDKHALQHDQEANKKKKGKAAVSGIANCPSFSANFCGFTNTLALSKQPHIYLRKKSG